MLYELTDLAIEQIFVKESLSLQQRADKVQKMILQQVAGGNGVVLKPQGKSIK